MSFLGSILASCFGGGGGVNVLYCPPVCSMHVLLVACFDGSFGLAYLLLIVCLFAGLGHSGNQLNGSCDACVFEAGW